MNLSCNDGCSGIHKNATHACIEPLHGEEGSDADVHEDECQGQAYLVGDVFLPTTTTNGKHDL